MGNEIENLNIQQLTAALATGGYTEMGIVEAEFVGSTVRGAARYMIRSSDGSEGYIIVENVPGVGFVGDF